MNAGTITGGSTGIYGGTTTINSGAVTGGTYGVNTGTITIKDGEIFGGNYGIFNATNVVGSNDSDLNITNPSIEGGMYGVYGGTTKFFDGVVKGAVDGFSDESSIRQIPDGTITHTEEVEDKQNTWLIQGENYLEVDGVEYNSMTKAYEAITGNAGTIKVIASTTISAAMPTFTGKTITLNLNGKQLNLNQTLGNAGVLNIVDNSAEGNGKLANINNGTVISNTGAINVKSGTIESSYRGIYSENTGATVTVDGGKVVLDSSNSSNDYAAIYAGSNSKVNLKSGEIIVKDAGSGISTSDVGVTISMTGGKITANSNNTVKGVYCGQYAYYDRTCTASYTGGEIDVKGKNAYGIYNGRNTITNFKITATGSSEGYGIRNESNNWNSIITDSEIVATGSTSYGLYAASKTINGNTTISGGTYGIANGTTTINSGAISGGNTGISGSTTTMNAGTITGGSTGIYGGTYTINSGTVTGGTYGVNTGTVTIKDGEIFGGNYGIFNATNVIGIQ